MNGLTDSVTETEKRDALSRLLDDSHLEGADRLRAFLIYIVDEELAGRGEHIRGKTIAQDVYGRDTSEGSDPENVVRVDARRLRQFLELYYEGAGKNDPVRLYMDSGGYRPRFESVEPARSHRPVKRVERFGVPVGTFAVGALIGAFIANSLLLSDSEHAPGSSNSVFVSETSDLLQRAAIYEKSPAALQAFNLAQQARAMIFPIFDRPRQILVLSVFERVIEIDPDYFGGYAGAAQALATLSVITPPSDAKNDYTAAAMEFANEAVRLAPDQAWSQSAKSWAYFANQDYEAALMVGRRAAQLDPEDGAVLDFLGAVALFSGAFAEAVETADRQTLVDSSNQRFANRNISGAAHFHLGDYEKTIQRFEEAKRLGDPLSAPSLAYQVAAFSVLGRDRQAQAKLAELERAWPNAPIATMLKSIYSNDKHADDVVNELLRQGWSPPSLQ
ncbi:tetratricopeptide repeat protein [Ruegeria sp. SCP11]|uniref:tetratricopeptide repeat protein n=1 Tax=Ruegeria sp. SCP11 TaxID=3141378 RepID=UPI00333A7D2A